MADHALHVLDCGTLTFPRYGIYFNGGEEIIVAPIPAHVITHPVSVMHDQHTAMRPTAVRQS